MKREKFVNFVSKFLRLITNKINAQPSMVLTYKVIDRVVDSTDSDAINKKDSTIFVPAVAGAKVADAVFICNPDTDYVEYECSVKSINGNQLELSPIHYAEEHPWLSIDSLVENDILTSKFAETGVETLTKTATIQLKTIFASPERYK